jgi:hypothetical protein
MCAVAGRSLFRGYDSEDLAGVGIGFSLFDMPALAVLARRIVAEEQAMRRPVTVTIASLPDDRSERIGASEPVGAIVPAPDPTVALVAPEPAAEPELIRAGKGSDPMVRLRPMAATT